MLALQVSFKFVPACIRGRTESALYAEAQVLLFYMPGYIPL